MADERNAEGQEAAGKSGSRFKKIGIWLGAALLITGISVPATLYLSGSMASTGGDKGGEESAAGDHGGGGGGGHGGGHGSSGAPGKAVYHPLKPPFVVNFRDKDVLRFLQVGVEIMAEDKSAVKAIKHHDAAIRNNLMLLFSSQHFKDIATRRGKEKLRQEALSEIRQLLKERTGKPGVKQVYFTRFVMQ